MVIADLAAWLSTAIDHERAGTFRDIRPERFRQFLALLPPAPAPCTVGGTKGKGSTVRLIEAALRAHGQRTLAFTSPHVHCVHERWRLDGIPASEAQLIPAAETVAAVERSSGAALTYFERTAAMAVVLAAARPGVHLLWEVGLGGRLDCANALDCAVAVITHLSHDHRDVLGPTLWHIAREKLPIARQGRPLLIAPQGAEAHEAIQAAIPAGVEATWIHRSDRPFELALPGDHQQDNASTALAAARLLLPSLEDSRARAGMAEAVLAARCQLVRIGGRRLLIDGAHNGPSIAATLAVARQVLRPGWRVAIGLAGDKEGDEIAAALGEDLPSAIRCGYDSPRARRASDWPAAFAATPWFPSIHAVLAAYPHGDLCITGSLYLAGEALRAVGQEGMIPG